MLKMTKQKNNRLDAYAKFSGIVVQMLVIIGGGSWIGYEIDENSSREFPLFTIILSLISIAIALYLVIRQANRLNNGKK